MRAIVNYNEIERRYREKGDRNDKEFCQNAGINVNSYYSRRQQKGKGLSLIVALLIADYLECEVKDFCEINWNFTKI